MALLGAAIAILTDVGKTYPGFWCFVHTHDGIPVRRLTLSSFKVTCRRCGKVFLAERTIFGLWSYTEWTEIEDIWFRARDEFTVESAEQEPASRHR